MTDEERLEELLDRWEQTQSEGSRRTPEEMCRDCPELLESFRRRLGLLRRVDGFLRDGTPAPPAEPVPGSKRSTAGATPKDRASSGATLPAVPGYEMLGVLGRGGMGVVYKARQVALGRVVALKMIRDGVLAGPRERARFRAEAKAVARLQHPNIVQVHDLGEQDGRPFFTLELCEGGSLDRKLAGKPLDPRKAARLVEVLARAVQAAHQAGVVHRDLKPANVLIARDNVPKITDFGLAKQLDQPGQTGSGAILGTPAFMAPEQAAGRVKEVGPAADVYALGAILYVCLTGRPPFKGATTLDTLRQVTSDAPVPPRRLQPAVPAGLEVVCLRCLEKTPPRRYPSAAALADDLQRFLAGSPTIARPGASRRLRRRAVVALLSAALLLVLGGSAAVIAWRVGVGHARQAEADARQREAAERAEQERRQAEEAEERWVADLLLAIGRDGGPPAAAERAAFRNLAASGDRVRRRFLEEGLRQPNTAARLARRSALVVQAAVGLDADRREKAAALVLAGLSDERADPQVREACLLLGTALGLDARETFRRQATRVAAAALARTTDPGELADLVEWVSADGERPSATAAGCLVDSGLRAGNPQALAVVVRGLMVLSPRLAPPDAAFLVERLLGAMGQTGNVQTLAELARAVGVLAGRLGPEQAELAGRAAVTLLDRTVLPLPTADPKLLAVLARAVAALPGRQAAEKAEKLAGHLLAIAHLQADPGELVEIARAVFVLAERLDAEAGAALAAAASNQVLGTLIRAGQVGQGRLGHRLPATGPADPASVFRLVQVLDRRAERLSSGAGAQGIADAAAGMLMAAAFQPTSPAVADALARVVVRLSARMPSAKAEELASRLVPIAGRTADPHVLAGLVRALAALAARLPPNHPVRLDASLPGRLLDGVDTAADPFALAGLGEAAAALPARAFPEGRVTAGVERLLHVLARTADPYARMALGQAAAALAGHLGPARGPQAAIAAIDSLLDAMTRTDDPDTLADLLRTTGHLLGRLNPEQRRRPAAAALSRAFEGTAAFGQEAEVLAAQLPPADLAALLADPLCVGQGRRLLLRELSVRLGPPLPARAGAAAACAVLQADPFLACAAAGWGAALYPAGRRLFADVWETADYLRAHYPAFDLSGSPSAGSGS